MNDLETPASSRSDLADLQERYDSLRQAVNTILILLVLVSGTLTVFLYHQYRGVHQEVQAVREQLNRFQQIKPKLDDFERRISDFAATHPDFALIIAKYATRPPVPAPAPVLPAAATPGAAPKK